MNKSVSKINNKFCGEITIPSDKSISHRAIIFSSLAKGKSIIKNFSNAKDPISSLNVCKALGVDCELKDNTLWVNSTGIFSKPFTALNCGNSGTTMRLMSGILAGQNFNSILTGDESLSKRPMKRVIEPLTLMGAKLVSDNGTAPLQIYGQKLHGIDYAFPIASAQVKSAVLLAGLFAEGVTSYSEPSLSRNHTELLLKNMGANIQVSGLKTIIQKSELQPVNFEIPGDISSAAYFIAAALVVPNSKIILKNIGLNSTRTGFLDVVKNMGGNFEILNKFNSCGEDIGDVLVEYSDLKSCIIEGDLIPRLIDEIPIIAVLATQAEGTTIIKDACDLRNKESDRIKITVSELKKLGANIEETADGMIIQGKTKLQGDVVVETCCDHRLAMSLYVAGLICEKEIMIKDFEWINISFPEFELLFNSAL